MSLSMSLKLAAKSVGKIVLDMVFPKRCPWCGAVVGFEKGCACDAGRQALALPNAPVEKHPEGTIYYTGIWACYSYEEPVRAAILRFKFEGEKELAAAFGAELAAKYTACGLAGGYDLIVAAPSNKEDTAAKDYNHSALLAQELALLIDIPFAPDALAKTKQTEHQMSLDRAGRLRNLEDAFMALPEVQGKRVLLVDDIATTGSTVNECAKALLQAGAARCTAICLASTSVGQT